MPAPAAPPITSPATAASLLEQMLAQAVDVSSDAVFCQDSGGRVLTWNAAAERLYGLSSAQVLGLRLWPLLPPGTCAELRAAHASALAGRRVERFDSQHARQDGSAVPVAVSAVPLRDVTGLLVGVATTVADVTERRALSDALARTRVRLERQNAALVRSNRDLEQFAYVASHDLSEPLRVMTGFVGRLEHRYADVLDERGLRYMQHVVDACARMRSLVEDLLDYSRYLQAPREGSVVDTGAVLADVLRALDDRLRETGGRVEVADLPPVWSDPSQLASLLTNLVSNALKFHPDGHAPRVVVAGTVVDGWVTLTVDDDGIGIEPEYRDRVFRMFQRLHVREAYAGTGIGLAIAQQIVEVQGGRIWVEDSALGGARFCCTLPDHAPEGEDDRA